MNPQSPKMRNVLRRFLVVSAVTAILLGGLCGFFRVHRPADLLAYYGMSRECHPLWREFALRRVNAGDSASEFLKRFPPDRVETSGATEILTYYQLPVPRNGISFTGLFVSVRENQLVAAEAMSCTWHFAFF